MTPCPTCGSARRVNPSGRVVCGPCDRRRAKARYETIMRDGGRCADCGQPCDRRATCCRRCAGQRLRPIGARFVDTHGYVMVKTIEGWRLEHHVAWGELIPPGYVLHHRNEDRTDNRRENLELLTRGEHAALHARRRADRAVAHRDQ